jgi:hypothetical protein
MSAGQSGKWLKNLNKISIKNRISRQMERLSSIRYKKYCSGEVISEKT